MNKVLVVGATGSVGRHVVSEAFREGYAVRALVRDASQGQKFPPGIDVVVGDLTRSDTLAPAVDGISAVIFTHGSNGRRPGPEAVDYGGVRNVLAALRGRTVRIALMTAISVTDRKVGHDWKRRGERLVRASGQPYTIVRPGWFDYNAPDQHRLVLLQGDRRQSGTPQDGAVARRQIAEVLVRSLRSDTAIRKTFELVADSGPEPEDFDALFATLDPDAKEAIDGAHDIHNMPVSTEPPAVQEELETISNTIHQ